jgi:hypothetical protein
MLVVVGAALTATNATREQKDMQKYLNEIGLEQYATAAYIESFAANGIADIDDLTAEDVLVDQKIYKKLKPPMLKEHADKIVGDYPSYTMTKFLTWVPDLMDENNLPKTRFITFLPNLLQEGYEDASDVSDIEDNEAKALNMTVDELSYLTEKADEYNCYTFATQFLEQLPASVITGTASKKMLRDADVEMFNLYRQELVEAQVESYEELAKLTAEDVPKIPAPQLTAMKKDRRVLEATSKNEL